MGMIENAKRPKHIELTDDFERTWMIESVKVTVKTSISNERG